MLTAAKGLKSRGHNVFIASKKNSILLKKAEENNINTIVFNIRGDFSPFNVYLISKFLRENNIDVLICNLNKDVRVAGLAAKFVKTPLVVARHGMLLCGKKFKHKITLTNLVDTILTNSESIKKVYNTYGWFNKDYVKVIYNGIQEKNNIIAYNYSNDYPNKKIIVSAGRLSYQKGFIHLIKAASILNQKRDDLIFFIYGEGKLKTKLQEEIKRFGLKDKVILAGFKNNLDKCYKGCNLFVLSSEFEGMPNVVMEAMAVGKAVVAADVNGVKELIEDGKSGIIVPPKNPEAITEAINLIIDDEEKLKNLGENGAKRVRKNFTIPIMIDNLEKYFYERLKNKNWNNSPNEFRKFQEWFFKKYKEAFS